MRRSLDLGLYLVIGPDVTLRHSVEHVALAAVAGGVTAVQLRCKDVPTRTFVALAQALRGALDVRNMPLLINDRVDVALAVGAAGVHVGQSDMRPDDARRLLGPDALIGFSITNVAEANALLNDAALRAATDYVGVGPVFATNTKLDAAPALWLARLAKLCAMLPVPTVAIGGIQLENAREVYASGVSGIAVVSAICAAEDATAAAQCLIALRDVDRDAHRQAGRDDHRHSPLVR